MKKITIGLRAFVVSMALLSTNPSFGQVISTVAGTGTAGFSGDGGQATAANFSGPNYLAADRAGNFYVADALNNRLRKVSASGIVTTLIGDGSPGFSGDGGPATAAEEYQASSLIVDTLGNIYFGDLLNNRVRKISASGIVTTLAGTGTAGYSGDGGPATNAELNEPYGLALDPAGNIIFADEYNHVIRKISTSGTITTIAGNGSGGYSGDGGLATAATLFYPNGLTTDRTGNIYFTDNTNHRIRKINTSGVITTIVGNGTEGFSGDGGPATDAEIEFGCGLKFDNYGNLYYADGLNNRIRMISPSGIITTFAGSGTAGFSGDGGPAIAADLNYPLFLEVDNSGNFFIADMDNNRIRKIGAFSNHPPAFTGELFSSISVCTGASATSIDVQLAITDVDTGQTETWSIATAPHHGSLAGLSTSAISTGAAVFPSGVSYTPASGYVGNDTFKINVSDGHASDSMTMIVYVNPTPTPGPITGIDTVCIGDTVRLSDSWTGGIWSSINPAIATTLDSGWVAGVSGGIDSIIYTASNACGSVSVRSGFYVKSIGECNEGVSIITVHNAAGVTIYPSPNNGNFTVLINSTSQQIGLVTISNITGQKVYEMPLNTNNGNSISLNVPDGVYFLSTTVDGSTFNEKIIITK